MLYDKCLQNPHKVFWNFREEKESIIDATLNAKGRQWKWSKIPV